MAARESDRPHTRKPPLRGRGVADRGLRRIVVAPLQPGVTAGGDSGPASDGAAAASGDGGDRKQPSQVRRRGTQGRNRHRSQSGGGGRGVVLDGENADGIDGRDDAGRDATNLGYRLARPLVQTFTEAGRAMATITYPEDDEHFRLQYVGRVQRQRPHGQGDMRWRKGNYVRFTGEFKAGEMHHGTLYFGPQGRSQYSGDLRHSRADGSGVLEPDEGDDCVLARYDGGWQDGLKCGVGTAEFRNGDIYVGQWHKNRMYGSGRYVWRDGTVFTGQFVDDEMHGRGSCRWPSGREVDIAFTHSYPNAVRFAVRVLCVLLLLMTLLYVLPHLYDFAETHVDDFSGLSGQGASSDGTGGSPADALTDPLAGLPRGCSCPCSASMMDNVIAQFHFVRAQPWLWLWPWSAAQLLARERAREEANVLAEQGIGGLSLAWNLTATPDASFPLAACPCDCDYFSQAQYGNVRDDDSPDTGDDPADEGFVSADDDPFEFWDDSSLLLRSEVEEIVASNASRYGLERVRLFGDDGSDGLQIVEQQATQDVASAVPEGSDACEGEDCPAVDIDAVDRVDGLNEGSRATVSTVLTLYLRLHMKRQLHYLRLGMIALFVMTGDLEDSLSALLWPVVCFVCRFSKPRTVCGITVSDKTVFWLALWSSTALWCLACTLVVVVLPEGIAEVVRLSCYDSSAVGSAFA